MYAGLAFAVLIMLRLASGSWTKTWVGPGGRALARVPADSENTVVTGDGLIVAS